MTGTPYPMSKLFFLWYHRYESQLLNLDSNDKVSMVSGVKGLGYPLVSVSISSEVASIA
jgi:lantibiotic modifying enzyme